MALDPQILAALSGAAKSSAAFDPTKVDYGTTASTGGAWNLGQWAIDVLSTGGYASAGFTNKIGQNIAAISRGEIGAAADLINPITGIGAAFKGVSDRRTYSDNLKEMGVDEKIAPWLGLALDIGLDPTTYITGGTLAGAKGALQGAKLAATATKTGSRIAKAGEVADIADITAKAAGSAKIADALIPVNRPLTQSEKLGNLLTGINRGYQTGKLQYSVTSKTSKASRLSAKEAKKLKAVRSTVDLPSNLIKAVGRAENKLAKAEAKLADKALPGITAGAKKADLVKTAATAAAKTAGEVAATVEKSAKGFEVVIKTADGVITNHSAAGKVYKTEKNAEKAAANAVAKIQREAAEQIPPVTQMDATAPNAAEETLRRAIATDDVANKELAVIREQLAPLSKLSGELDKFARTIPLAGSYVTGLKPSPKNLDKLVAQVQTRLAELADSELGALAVSAKAIEKLSTDNLLAIIRKPAAERTAQEQKIFEEIAKQEIAIPVESNELAAEVAKVLDKQGIATLTSKDGTSTTIKLVTKEQRAQWAADINADKEFVARIAENKKLIADTEAKLVTVEKQLDRLSADLQKSTQELIAAGKKSSAANTKLSNEVEKLSADADALRVQISDYKQGNIPGDNSKYGWWTSTEKLTGEDYFAFVNKVPNQVEEFSVTGALKGMRAAEKDKMALLKALPVATRSRLGFLDNRLMVAKGAEREMLLAERAKLEDLYDLPPLAQKVAEEVKQGARVSRTGLAETASMGMLARLSKSKDSTIATQATDLFAAGRDQLAIKAAEGATEVKPWIDGIVTANDSGKAARAFIRYAAPELAQTKPEFKAAAKIIEDALEGKLKAAAGGADAPLSADDVAQVFEEFLSGRDFSKALDELGNLDVNKILEPQAYASIDELAADLSSGKIDLTPAQLAGLTRVMGIPADSTTAANKLITQHADSVASLVKRGEEMEIARKAARDYITGKAKGNLDSILRGEVTVKTAVEATGQSNGVAAALELETLIQPKQIEAAAADVVDAVRSGTEPNLTPEFSAEATQSITAYREAQAAEFNAKIQSYGTEQLNVLRGTIETLRDVAFADINKQLAAIAEKRGQSLESLLEEAITNNWTVISEDPSSLLMTGAFKATSFGPESRFGVLKKLSLGKGAPAIYKAGGSPEQIFERETRVIGLLESLVRTLGLPVRSEETFAATLRRVGVMQTGDLLPEGTIALRSNVTYSDILESIYNSGNKDLVWELRKYRGKKGQDYAQGNFPPNAIEAAWLVVNNLKSSGKEIVKGTPEYEEVMFALSNIYQKPADITKNVDVSSLFAPSYQSRAASKLGAAEAASIEKASDALITHLSDNWKTLADLDSSRTVMAATADGKSVYEETAKAFLGLLHYSLTYKAAKTQAVAGQVFLRNEQFETFGGVMKAHEGLLDFLGTANFHDPELAKNISTVHASVLMNLRLPGAAGSADTVSGLPALHRELSESLAKRAAMKEAGDKAAAAGKATDAPKKNARNQKATTVARQDEQIAVDVIAKSGQLPEEIAMVSDDVEVAVTINQVNTKLAKANGIRENVSRMFNPNLMSREIKTLLNAAEQNVYSRSHQFGLILQGANKIYKGREADVIKAFSAIQKYRSEAQAAASLGMPIAKAEEWLQAAGINADPELVHLFDGLTNALFGSETAFGAGTRSGILASELNVQLQKSGLGAFRVMNDAEVDTFWTRINVEDFEGKNPFKLLDQFSYAINKTITNIEFGESLNSTFGKTLAEIKAAGEAVDDYVKIDPEDVVGRLLGNSDLLFPKDVIEKLRYVNDYLSYDKTFGDGALNSIVMISDGVVSNLKATQTVFRPAHWVVSTVGEAAMNWLAGVKISSYVPAGRLLNKVSPDSVGKDLDAAIKAYLEKSAPKGMKLKAGEVDDIWFVMGDKRVLLNDDLVAQAAQDLGIIISPHSPALEDFLRTGDSFKKSIFNPINKLAGKLSPWAAKRDNYFRLTHFVDELKRTKASSFEEAARIAATRVREWHPTVGSLSAFEQKYMRRLVYFYTWQKTALVKVMSQAVERPGVFTVPSKVQYAFADYNGLNPESFGDPWDPQGIYASWHTGQLWGPQFGSQGDAWGIQPAIQPIDVVGQVFKPFTVQPGQSPIDSVFQGVNDTFASNLNPLVKILMESSSKSRLGTGAALPSPSEYLIGQVGVLSTFSKLTGIGQDPNPYETPEQKAENDRRLLLNFALGQRITDYNTPSTDYKWKLDQQEMIKRLAGQ